MCSSQLNRQLQQDISYVIRLDPGVQTKEKTLDAGRRFVPRLDLAAGAAAASPWLRRCDSCPAI